MINITITHFVNAAHRTQVVALWEAVLWVPGSTQ